MGAKKRQDKDIEIKDLHCSLRVPGDPENQAPESPQTASSSTQQSAVLIPRSGLPPFPPFDPLSNPANTGPRWRKWLRRFENLLISLRETDPIVKRGLLLTYVGETTNDIGLFQFISAPPLLRNLIFIDPSHGICNSIFTPFHGISNTS